LARGDRGVNRLDAACREHDIAYSRSDDLSDRHAADRILADRARERITARDSTLGEKAAASAIWAAMRAKTKLGGLLPFLPMLGALGSLIGGAAGVAKAVNDGKVARRQLEELQRHNRTMESRGLYLVPYKRGSSARTKGAKKSKKSSRKEKIETLNLPLRGVTTS